MKVSELRDLIGATVITGETGLDNEIQSGYCCDLLSWVIGRAEDDDALVTVMSNPNVIAVSVMADLPCVILAEGVRPDAVALEKAKDNDVIVLSSMEPTYATAVRIHTVLSEGKL